MWTGVLRKISITFQAKRTGNYMVYTMLLAAVLHFAQAPMCSASQLSLLVSNRKSSRTLHRSAPVLQNEFGNCTVAVSKNFSKYLDNYIIQYVEGTWQLFLTSLKRSKVKHYLTTYVHVKSNCAVLLKLFFCKTKGAGILLLQKWLLCRDTIYPVCFFFFVCVY